MTDTTYVDQLRKTLAGEFYFGTMYRETRRRIAISTDTSKGKLRYSQSGETIVSCRHCQKTLYLLFSRSDGNDDLDRPYCARGFNLISTYLPETMCPVGSAPETGALRTPGGGLGRLDVQNLAGARDRDRPSFHRFGISRTKSTCRSPFSSLAPLTTTWSASWKLGSKVRSAMPL
jgi:hypothetical protein